MILGLSTTFSFALTEFYVDFENGTNAPRTCTDTTTDECKTIQYALDTVTAAAGGSRINIENDGAAMTQTLSASVDFDTNTGTADNPIIVQGYSSTPGDGVRALIDGNSAAVNCFNGDDAADFIIFKDLELKGSTGDAFETGGSDNCAIENVKITNSGAKGIDLGAADGGWLFMNLEITLTSADAFDVNSSTNLLAYSYIHDITGRGINIDANAMILGNIVDTTSDHNVFLNSEPIRFIGNTFYNATGAGDDNISDTGGIRERLILINNILNTSNGDSLVIAAGSNIWFYFGNVIETKSGTIFLESLESTADPQFDGAAGGDFNIGSNMDNIAYPQDSAGAFGGEVQTSDGYATDQTNEPGVVSFEETGGGACTNAFGVIQ